MYKCVCTVKMDTTRRTTATVQAIFVEPDSRGNKNRTVIKLCVLRRHLKRKEKAKRREFVCIYRHLQLVTIWCSSLSPCFLSRISIGRENPNQWFRQEPFCLPFSDVAAFLFGLLLLWYTETTEYVIILFAVVLMIKSLWVYD